MQIIYKLFPVFLILFLLLICFACFMDHSPVKRFNKDFKKRIDKPTIQKIKDSQEDLLYQYFATLKDDLSKSLEKNNELNLIFERNGIDRIDSKYFILINSFHRSLNNEAINFEELIKTQKDILREYNKWGEENRICEEKKHKIAKANFNQIILGDTMNFSLPVDFNDYMGNAFYYDCPSGYVSDSSEYLLITGLILEKYTFVNNNYSISWLTDLSILDLSIDSIQVLLRDIGIQDTLTIDLGDYGRYLYENGSPE